MELSFGSLLGYITVKIAICSVCILTWTDKYTDVKQITATSVLLTRPNRVLCLDIRRHMARAQNDVNKESMRVLIFHVFYPTLFGLKWYYSYVLTITMLRIAGFVKRFYHLENLINFYGWSKCVQRFKMFPSGQIVRTIWYKYSLTYLFFCLIHPYLVGILDIVPQGAENLSFGLPSAPLSSITRSIFHFLPSGYCWSALFNIENNLYSFPSNLFTIIVFTLFGLYR